MHILFIVLVHKHCVTGDFSVIWREKLIFLLSITQLSGFSGCVPQPIPGSLLIGAWVRAAVTGFAAALCQQTAQSTLGAQRRDLHWLKGPAQGRAVHQSTKPQPGKGHNKIQTETDHTGCRRQFIWRFFCLTRSCNDSSDIWQSSMNLA